MTCVVVYIAQLCVVALLSGAGEMSGRKVASSSASKLADSVRHRAAEVGWKGVLKECNWQQRA